MVTSLTFETLEKFGKRLRKSGKVRAFVSYFNKLLKQPKSGSAKMNRMKKFGTYGGGLFLFGILFGFMVFPKILKFAIHKQITLKPGTDVRSIWSKVPFFIGFRIYLFNVTNPDEIKNGEKPILRQVGPYYFEEWHEKENLVDNDNDDTVEYNMKDTFYFKPDKSGGLTGEEELMLPHIFILSTVMATLREKPTAMPVINKAINSVFKNPDNVFIKAKAMDLMFRGLPIDCSVTDTPGTALCNIVREKKEAFIVDDENHFRFSLFGPKNATAAKERFKSARGVKKQVEIGRVLEYDGKKNISKWNDNYCDTFNGTDGYVFHPFLYKNEDIVAFAAPICRSVSLYYVSQSRVLGIDTNRYTMWLGDPNTIPQQKCYCPANGCLKAGVMDLHKCLRIPLVASHPHFYRADAAYLEMVDGLKPNYKEHAMEIDIEPYAGSSITGKKRLQLNIMVFPVEKFKIMKNFPEALLPLFWIEEDFVLPKNLAGQVKILQTVRGIVKFMSIMMILGGLGLLGFTGFLFYQEKQAEKVEVMNVAWKNGNNLSTYRENRGDTKSDAFGLNINNLKRGPVPPPIN